MGYIQWEIYSDASVVFLVITLNSIHINSRYSICNFMDFAKIYSDVSEYGWAYFWFSVIALIFLHNTYFYWTHRLVQHPKIFKYMHLVHHKSNNPTRFAAYSFHHLEAIIQAGIILLVVIIMPVHNGALFIFITFFLL